MSFESDEAREQGIAILTRKKERFALLTDAIFELVNCQLAMVQGEAEAAERAFERAVKMADEVIETPMVDITEWSLPDYMLNGILLHERQLIDVLAKLARGDEDADQESF